MTVLCLLLVINSKCSLDRNRHLLFLSPFQSTELIFLWIAHKYRFHLVDARIAQVDRKELALHQCMIYRISMLQFVHLSNQKNRGKDLLYLEKQQRIGVDLSIENAHLHILVISKNRK